MVAITVSKARQDLYRLVDKVKQEHEPIIITGKRNNAVLISEEDYKSIQETLHLASIPGMVESIKEGMNTPASEMDEEVEW